MFVKKDVTINSGGGFLTVTPVIGFAQHADFECKLFDTQGNNPQKVFDGSTLGSDPPPFALNVLAPQLAGRFFMLKAVVQNLGSGPGQQFSVTARFSQDGAALDAITGAGSFANGNTEVVTLVARFT